MLDELKNMLKFFRNNIGLVIISFSITISLYGIKLANNAQGMDTNYYIKDPLNYFNHWNNVGRYGEFFLKKAFWESYTNLYLYNVFAFILFAFSPILLCFLFSKIIDAEKFKYQMYIIPIIFLSSAIFTTQFYFTLQIFAFNLAIILTIMSVFFVWQIYENKKRNILAYLLPVALLFISMGVYQSFILFYISLVASVMLLTGVASYKTNERIYLKEFLKKVTPYMIVFLSAI